MLNPSPQLRRMTIPNFFSEEVEEYRVISTLTNDATLDQMRKDNPDLLISI